MFGVAEELFESREGLRALPIGSSEAGGTPEVVAELMNSLPLSCAGMCARPSDPGLG